MKAALARNDDAGAAALKEFAVNALGYAGLLRNHIHKEDNILFGMADERLAAAVQDELVAAFEKVEEEEIGPQVHEKYHEMAHDLVSTYLR